MNLSDKKRIVSAGHFGYHVPFAEKKLEDIEDVNTIPKIILCEYNSHCNIKKFKDKGYCLKEEMKDCQTAKFYNKYPFGNYLKSRTNHWNAWFSPQTMKTIKKNKKLI